MRCSTSPRFPRKLDLKGVLAGEGLQARPRHRGCSLGNGLQFSLRWCSAFLGHTVNLRRKIVDYPKGDKVLRLPESIPQRKFPLVLGKLRCRGWNTGPPAVAPCPTSRIHRVGRDAPENALSVPTETIAADVRRAHDRKGEVRHSGGSTESGPTNVQLRVERPSQVVDHTHVPPAVHGSLQGLRVSNPVLGVGHQPHFLDSALVKNSFDNVEPVYGHIRHGHAHRRRLYPLDLPAKQCLVRVPLDSGCSESGRHSSSSLSSYFHALYRPAPSGWSGLNVSALTVSRQDLGGRRSGAGRLTRHDNHLWSQRPVSQAAVCGWGASR